MVHCGHCLRNVVQQGYNPGMNPYQMPMNQFVPGINQHCITQAEVDYRNDMRSL